MTTTKNVSITAIDSHSVHKITSGQVVIDLQTAVKELVENSLDASATNIEVRFKDYGLKSVEVVDNGSGIASEDYDSVALKHHTSKLSSFEDLSTVMTFGFRGEALSSLCALCESVVITTATASEAPMGTILEIDRNGRVKNCTGKTARQRGTTVTVTGLFKPLPVRRKELERNAKREFGKALNLLSAYALLPCVKENKGVRLTVSNHSEGGRKTVQLRTDGTPSTRASVSALWGPKSLEHLVDLDLCFNVETEKSVLRRRRTIPEGEDSGVEVRVCGLVSKFAVACGRAATDRQFFYINGRPCNPSKVQKAFNEVYRSFNATQSPFVIADFILPTNTCDINVSPDKRTIFLHSESNLVEALKKELEESFSPSRSTFDVNTLGTLGGHATSSQIQRTLSQTTKEAPHLDEATHERSSDPQRELDSCVQDVAAPIVPTKQKSLLPDITPTSSSRGSESVKLHSVETIDQENRSGEFLDYDKIDDADLVSGSSSQSELSAESFGLAHDAELSDPIAHRSDSSSAIPEVRLPSVARPISQNSRKSSTPTTSAHSPAPQDDGPSTILSSRRKSINSSPSPTLGASEPVQMVLDTSGASWDLRASSAGSERPTKRPRLAAKEGVEARQSLRAQLLDFAKPGSQVAQIEVDTDEDEGGVGMALGNHSGRGTTPIEVDGRMHLDQNADNGLDREQFNRPSMPLFLEEDDEAEVGALDSPKFPMKSGPQESVIDLTGNVIPQDDINSIDVDPRDITAVSTSPIEIVRTLDNEGATLRFNLPNVSTVWRDYKLKLASLRNIGNDKQNTLLEVDASISNTDDNGKAVDALSRVISKTDFSNMEVIGQFNRGFIIARRIESTGQTDDLFIVDQHAADEKYNFETLQQNTKIESQTLFRSEALELTTADELLAVENLAVLRQNGFDVRIDENALPGRGERLKLVARPVSKGTEFDMKDLEELIDLMRDRPTGQMVRCSKARAMFAMRACRKSVMIGMPLTKSQMTTIVRHMGAIEQPWNCPHGRPTMRHLSDISTFVPRMQQQPTTIDWAGFTSI